MEVIVRDQKIETHSYCIDEDDITLNIDLVQRSSFKRYLERGRSHAFIATGKIIYTTDESLYEYFEEYKQVGKRDVERAIFNLGIGIVYYLYKIEKWIKVKKDLTYARLYALKAVENIAQMEVYSHLEIPTREAILRVKVLSPEIYRKFYEKPMDNELSEEELYFLLDEMDKYLLSHIEPIMNVVKECLGDGEIKTVTQICKFYKSDSHDTVELFEYLADKNLIQKLSQTIRITPKSKMSVEEIAYILPNF